MFVLFVVLIYCSNKVEAIGIPIQQCKESDGTGGYKASPTARVCDNDANYCDYIFPLAGINVDTHVPNHCYDSSLANSCGRNCALCCKFPQYACADRLMNCAKFKADGFCESQTPTALKDCPSTCGLCDKPGVGGFPCPDLSLNCKIYYESGFNCNLDFMKEQCGQTCHSDSCQKNTTAQTTSTTATTTATSATATSITATTTSATANTTSTTANTTTTTATTTSTTATTTSTTTTTTTTTATTTTTTATTTTTTATTKSTTATTTDSTCKNLRKDCDLHRELCTIDSLTIAYMAIYCPKTCGFCK